LTQHPCLLLLLLLLLLAPLLPKARASPGPTDVGFCNELILHLIP
jgi:hypothetical protein